MSYASDASSGKTSVPSLTPSPSLSGLRESVPMTSSSVSESPSPSSSLSRLLPIPSKSVSVVSLESLGNASRLSITPSLSQSKIGTNSAVPLDNAAPGHPNLSSHTVILVSIGLLTKLLLSIVGRSPRKLAVPRSSFSAKANSPIICTLSKILRVERLL